MDRVKHLLAALLLFIALKHVQGQMAVFQDENALITPCFRADVIKAKGISQITIYDLAKPDNSPIKDDGIIHQYFFDSTGKVTASLYTSKANGNTWDTIKCTYCYDANNNLTIKRIQMGDFYDTWYYKWNKDHQVQSEYHVHETSNFSADGTFKISNQRVISADSFAYIIYPKQLQQYGINEDNKIFQKTITQYDDNKRFLSRSCHYMVGWLYSQVDVDYDSMGRMDSYVYTGNLNGEMAKKTSIKYDSLGNVTAQNVWVDGSQTDHIEYMYDATTGLVTDKLDRDFEKKTIFILRFSYIIGTVHTQATTGTIWKQEVSTPPQHKKKKHRPKKTVQTVSAHM